MKHSKVRYHTWYWGRWVWEGELGLTLGQDGVELYDEARHGWHLSDEAQAGGAP